MLCALLVCTLYASFIALAKQNFLYPVAYDMLDIDRTIAEFGRINRNKPGFHTTAQEEHYRLFAEIVDSVMNDGEGLDSIDYRGPDGDVIDTMLTPNEQIHLQDVANLINTIDVIGVAALGLFVALLLLSLYTGWRSIEIWRIHLVGGGIITGLIVLVITFGAVDVFYAAHTWVFPAGHQWFFYYEESLMTTLMKAPDLFGVIAVELGVLALVLYSLCLYSLKRVLLNST